MGLALWAGGLPFLPRARTAREAVVDAVVLLIAADGLQYVTHRFLAHGPAPERVSSRRPSWRGSHAVHHQHVRPSPDTAFVTGWRDALFQLLAPVLAATWCWRPSRDGLILFGAAYSVWLQWIHLGPRRVRGERLASRVVVTPAFHARHHANPRCNFGHVLTAWDLACGTAEWA
jgi:sterol desaturase/sphingolipid hydroxylase (fatty acid hydroxylase superfamily)